MLLSWCGWHVQVYAILWKCWHEHDMKHLSPWRKEKGATAVKRKWCHGNIPVQVTHGGTGAKGSVTWASHARWWGDPGFRVPMGRRHGKWGTCTKQTGTMQTYRTSHTCKGISSWSSRVIPSKRAFRGGSKSSREVVVHGTVVVEVVVHGRRGSSRSRRR